MISEKAPFLIVAFLGIIGAVPGLLLPETADLKLPETLEDMKELGKNDRFFWMPLCKANRFKGAEVCDTKNNIGFQEEE